MQIDRDRLIEEIFDAERKACICGNTYKVYLNMNSGEIFTVDLDNDLSAAGGEEEIGCVLNYSDESRYILLYETEHAAVTTDQLYQDISTYVEEFLFSSGDELEGAGVDEDQIMDFISGKALSDDDMEQVDAEIASEYPDAYKKFLDYTIEQEMQEWCECFEMPEDLEAILDEFN